ncbi:SprB repeat-containing protein, partial [Flavobacterium laiguense]
PGYTVEFNGVGGFVSQTSSKTYSGLVAGTYTWKVRDSKGCEKSGSEIVGQPTALIASDAHTEVTCLGDTDGSVTLTFSGGTAPYMVNFNGGGFATQTSPKTYTGLGAGTYNWTVKDDHGCEQSGSEVIAEGPSCGGPLCTYTQGYYGGSGTACTADGEFSSITVITNSINNMPGDVLYIGRGTSAADPGGSFTVTAAQAAQLNALMPGGGNAIVIGGDYTPFTITPLQNGKIKNVLLGQTVAMALNLYLTDDPSESIGNFSLVGSGGKYVVTKARATGSSCIDPVQADCAIELNAIESYLMPADVIAALPADADVWDLFQLAKNALGGQVYADVSLSEIVEALKAINNGFDKCRYFIEFSATAQLCPPLEIISTETEIAGFTAHPVPFKDQLTISYDLKYVTDVRIEV